MGFLEYFAIWLIIGLIHGLYLHKTECRLGTETLANDLIIIAFATVCGPIGVAITVVQLITEPKV